MALHCKTPPLRVGMVDRLSPIDRSLKSPQSVRQNSQTAVRRLRCASSRSHWGQWLYTVGRRRLRVGMVDRLSPIDRNLKPPQPVRQNSQTAVRRLRCASSRSHWGQWLYTVGRRRLRVGRSHWGGVLGGREKKRSRNRFGVLLVSGRFGDRTAHRKCGWVLFSPIDSKDE